MSTIAVRVDEQLKKEANAIYQELGLDMTTAIRLFLKQTVLTKSIPFPISLESSRIQMSDDDLADLMMSKMEGEHLDFKNQEHLAEFFDEPFPKYEVKNG